jgi:transketolase
MLSEGAYVLADAKGKPDIILMASGSEVHVCLTAKDKLAEKGISARVVSMPSWELFEATSREYQDDVLPPDVTRRLAVEAGISMGWERYVGDSENIVGINRFGASAPGGTVMEKFGFSVENIVNRAILVVQK